MKYKNIWQEAIQIPWIWEIKVWEVIELKWNIIDSRLEIIEKKEIKSKK